MRRTALLYVLPALVIGGSWLRLEDPRAGRDEVILVGLLALLPALAPTLWARAVAAAAVSVVALERAFDVSLLDARPFDERRFLAPLLSRFRDGVLDYYEVALPFAPADRPAMHGVVVVATFVFCLATALALAARRPLLATLLLVAGSAWPATLRSGGSLAHGALLLATVLLVLAAGRRRVGQPAAAVAAAVAVGVVAVAAASSPAVAKGEFLAWQEWDPYDPPEALVGVRYVWNANYGGVRFPSKRTTVLTVEGPERALYWRATTLDVFDGERWHEELPTFLISADEEQLTDDELLPAPASDSRRWTEARVRVHALRDDHLAGPAAPVRYDPNGIGVVNYGPNNVATVDGGLERGDSYLVWAYAPRPRPAQLQRVRAPGPRSGAAGHGYLQLLPGADAPAFAAPGRARALRSLVDTSVYSALLTAYRPLFDTAQRIAGRLVTPYAATVALEAWFRSGNFTYDEQPPLTRGTPALVSFVTGHRRGYCQHFAGAMALMLRSLGVPARVAAGFTAGSWDVDSRSWRVTDHDAHAWVEVWFEGWGWLPFDPTPGRGLLGASYTSASPFFDIDAVTRALGNAGGGLGRADLERAIGGPDTSGDVLALSDEQSRGESLLQLLALLALGLLAAVAATKLVVRRGRYLTRDPRRVCRACRAELVDFLADQGVTIPRSATLDEVAHAVANRYGVDARRFARAAGGARYGPPDRAPPQAATARRELRRLLRAIRGKLGATDRARGLASLRSLGFGG